MKELTFRSKKEELECYKLILDRLPALVILAELENLNDPTSIHNIWANSSAYGLLGYTEKEVRSFGPDYFPGIIHPDDLALIGSSIRRMAAGEKVTCEGVLRLRSGMGVYRRFMGSVALMEARDSKPWRFLFVEISIDRMKNSHERILSLAKNHLTPKNDSMTGSLTPREKEIIRQIRNCKTNREIADELYISPLTAKKHRNNILQKLKLKNTAALILFAIENELS